MNTLPLGFDPREHLRGRAIIPLLPEVTEDPSLTRGGQIAFETNKHIKADDLPDLHDVQGDVVYLFPKKAENFIFFRIADVASFRTALGKFQPSSSKDTADFVLELAALKSRDEPGHKLPIIPKSQYQISFSRMGLNALGVKDEVGDTRFDKFAMRDNKTFLDDQSDWDRTFEKTHFDPVNGSVGDDEGALHGVIIVAGSDSCTCTKASNEVKALFSSSITVVDTIEGRARTSPDHTRKNEGHEHFGYKDGVSQPALRGLTLPKPGQVQVNPGVIVMGYKGDPVFDDPDAIKPRPSWTRGGSMMAFRKLEQDVPEFHDWCRTNGSRWREFAPPGCPALSDDQGAELWGARMIGRWKSGAPLAVCPFKDDPKLAENDQKNNNFDYRVRGVPGVSPREHTDYYCPFTAHTRKTAPRDLDPYIQRSYLEGGMIVRASLPYGGEVSDEEARLGKTINKRGLLFACYQSNLDDGFIRQSTIYATNRYFPTTSLIPTYKGTDPILGSNPPKDSVADPMEVTYVELPKAKPETGDQVNLVANYNGDQISVSGFAKATSFGSLDPPGVPQQFFVTSRGGEYFFVPPISTLRSWASSA